MQNFYGFHQKNVFIKSIKRKLKKYAFYWSWDDFEINKKYNKRLGIPSLKETMDSFRTLKILVMYYCSFLQDEGARLRLYGIKCNKDL